MSKPTDVVRRTEEDDLSKMAQIAAAAEGLFEHPNMVPGHPPRHLSPREMIEATINITKLMWNRPPVIVKIL